MSEERNLSVEPSIIDFGCLQPGTSSCITIRIEGGPAKATINNERIKVTPSEIGEESIDIEVTIKHGSAGDLIWDTLYIQGDRGELEVPIIGWWDETLSRSLKKSVPEVQTDTKETTLEPIVPEQQTGKVSHNDISAEGETESTNAPMPEIHIPANASGRTYVAKFCPWCGKNLSYDSDKKLWMQCQRCIGNGKVAGVASRAVHEIRLSIADGKKTATDMWEIITGKQDWNLR